MFWVGEGIHKGKWMACTGIKPEPWCYQHHALTTKLIPGSQSFWLTLSWNALKNRSVSPLKGFLQVKLLGSLDRDSKVKVWTLLGDTTEHFYPVMTYFHKVWLNEGTEPHTTEKPFEQSFDVRATTCIWQPDCADRGLLSNSNPPHQKNKNYTECHSQAAQCLGAAERPRCDKDRKTPEATVSCPGTTPEFSQNGSICMWKTSNSI